MSQPFLGDIKTIVVVPIAEVVDVVSGQTVFAIIQCAEVRALTRTSEVSLKGWCARVQNRDCVGVIGPAVTESAFQSLILEFFERSTGGLRALLERE